jgi:hypothetical protein
MKFIVTRKNPDGTYDSVGMLNRYVTNRYGSRATLVRYGIPMDWQLSGVRIEHYPDDNIYGSPTGVSFHKSLGIRKR